ncbi:MAG: hypothetical protein OHK0036_10020 [Bacteroidia bacterium]
MYSLSDTTINKNIKLFQHSFYLNIGNSNFNFYTLKWDLYYNFPEKRNFKYDVVTDLDIGYSINIKGFECQLLNKYVVASFPFGNKDILFLLVGYNRRYHHNFLWGISLGLPLFYRVSIPEIYLYYEPNSCPTGIPCYPTYEYSKPAYMIQLNLAYKIFKNKNFILGINLQDWAEYFDAGKTWGNASEFTVINVFIKYLIFKNNNKKRKI